ncbi:hypothetical protein K491DRAFT_466901 [Lophiostoma macrostomum CBS 122681]|uniref:Uncharacterized protein n=1 Tax=Lophiostoma macrostomum CBS 122681 TaxID=1314788 RepID=A0A6A6T7M5_9PLEO|nr:hypothetical protein K491DRAFT_466901 [Lophiostoma macrostomum CBS 122681]
MGSGAWWFMCRTDSVSLAVAGMFPLQRTLSRMAPHPSGSLKRSPEATALPCDRCQNSLLEPNKICQPDPRQIPLALEDDHALSSVKTVPPWPSWWTLALNLEALSSLCHYAGPIAKGLVVCSILPLLLSSLPPPGHCFRSASQWRLVRLRSLAAGWKSDRVSSGSVGARGNRNKCTLPSCAWRSPHQAASEMPAALACLTPGSSMRRFAFQRKTSGGRKSSVVILARAWACCAVRAMLGALSWVKSVVLGSRGGAPPRKQVRESRHRAPTPKAPSSCGSVTALHPSSFCL